MSSNTYTVGVIGGGAVGLVYAALLSEAANVVVKTRRKEQAELINTSGINFKHGSRAERVFRNIRASADFAAVKNCDAIIIAVKSYDTDLVAEGLAAVVKPDALVLTVQNGLQAFGILCSTLKNKKRIFAGVTYVAAQRTDDRSVTVAASLRTVVDAQAKALVDVMKQTRLSIEPSDNYRQAIWDKLVFNVGHNALSAITNLHLGQMYETDACIDVATKILHEFLVVASTQGVSFDYVLMDKIRSNWNGSTFYPSMWQDLHQGKRTEIDALNGAISAMGKKHGVATPYNDMIVSLVKAREKSIGAFAG